MAKTKKKEKQGIIFDNFTSGGFGVKVPDKDTCLLRPYGEPLWDTEWVLPRRKANSIIFFHHAQGSVSDGIACKSACATNMTLAGGIPIPYQFDAHSVFLYVDPQTDAKDRMALLTGGVLRFNFGNRTIVSFPTELVANNPMKIMGDNTCFHIRPKEVFSVSLEYDFAPKVRKPVRLMCLIFGRYHGQL